MTDTTILSAKNIKLVLQTEDPCDLLVYDRQSTLNIKDRVDRLDHVLQGHK